MEIKSVIQKTAIATLVIMLSLALLAFNLACVLMPRSASDFFEWLGWGRLSVSLSREGYNRDGDINSLALLVERAIKYGDYDSVMEYAPQLQSSKHYGDFCEFKDDEGVTDFSDYASYIEGNYLIALYNKGESESCLELIEKHIAEPYDAKNPIRFLARFLSNSGKTYPGLIDRLKDKYRDEGATEEEMRNISVDLYSIYLNASDGENADYWRNEYLKHK